MESKAIFKAHNKGVSVEIKSLDEDRSSGTFNFDSLKHAELWVKGLTDGAIDNRLIIEGLEEAKERIKLMSDTKRATEELKKRKSDLHNDAKATAKIFRKHGLSVRVVYRKHYDPYVAVYVEANEKKHGGYKWIDVANTAMKESIAMGYKNDVFLSSGGKTETRAYNSLRRTNV